MCGVIGIIGPKRQQDMMDNRTKKQSAWAAYKTYRGLLTLQHRGQDAAGILSFDSNSSKFHCEKDLGLIDHVFSEEKVNNLIGDVAIGHTRYATTGGDGRNDLQPIVTGFPFGAGFVHNGNIVNYYSIAREMTLKNSSKLLTNNDLELFLHYFCNHHQSTNHSASGEKVSDEKYFENVKYTGKKIFTDLLGAYALVGIIADHGLIAMRDPNGIRPLVLGHKRHARDEEDSYIVCSETKTLNFLGYEYIRDLYAGEILLITYDGKLLSWTFEEEKKVTSPCMFEWVYFSGAESEIENKSVYGARLNLGKSLAGKVKQALIDKEISPDIVCPVPDTSRTSAIALAESLNMPYREALIKNRYVQRSFILSGQENREKAVELKLAPIVSEIKGKNILLVDDSIVRGTTSKKIISLLKSYGAKEITLAITCPPIRYGCFYGIDFPSEDELVAQNKNDSEIAAWVGANKVIFLNEDEVKDSIGLDQLCFGCITKTYPTSLEGGEEFLLNRRPKK